MQHIDPVCGMDVDPADSEHHIEYQAQQFYFCCAGCRDKFAANPEKYTNASPNEDNLPVIE
ncbi:MAG: YHS domain-containing protein, partial [Candidatus Eremiobacteraeota bacterium]|nr:YHS domain-containing protein [Candidatus Eremiobacteraeota bacterium]